MQRRQKLSNTKLFLLPLQMKVIQLFHLLLPLSTPILLLIMIASIIIRPKERLPSAVIVQLDLQISITNSMIAISWLSNHQMVNGF